MKQETKIDESQQSKQTQQHSSAPPSNQKRKKTAQQYKKQAEDNKKRWMPLIRYMKKQGIKFKTARCQKVRIQYFRIDELQDMIQKQKNHIEKDSVLRDLVRSWEKQVIYFARPQNFPKFKYPKQLQKSQDNSKQKFASFKFDSAESRAWLFPAILIGIIAVVLFPLWPYIVKYSVFMVCLVLVIAILSLIVLRLIIYLIFAIFGLSFWILPNFFADCTIAQSFQPIYSAKKWQGGLFSIVGRLLALSILGYYAYHVYADSSWIFENIQITKTSLDDLHDWGVSKIKGQKNFSQSALTNLDHIMNQTADVHIEEDVVNVKEQHINDQSEENNYQENQKLPTQQTQTASQQQETQNKPDTL